MKRLTVAIAFVSQLALLGGAEASTMQKQQWAPLDSTYLRSLYADKTWRWAHGAGYFAPNGQFRAWSRSKGILTEGFGTWDVRPEGLMCFTASWQEVPSNTQPVDNPKVETCFSHEAKGRRIAQMREPDGKWYIFKHAKTRKHDEFRKLRLGDQTHIAG
jgi:hypothetical protein